MQAVKNIYNEKTYIRVKECLFELVDEIEMGNEEYIETFISLFNYYEGCWNKAIAGAEAGQPGNLPWHEVFGAFCARFKIGFMEMEGSKMVSPLAITFLRQRFLKLDLDFGNI